MGLKCFRCGIDAVAICRYCGRAVCKDHVKEGPVIRHGVYCEGAIGAKKEWLEISGGVWCGICHIEPHGSRTEKDKFFIIGREAR